MLNNFLSSTKTLTGRLALFFTGVSFIVGVVTFLIFLFALQWSEDRVGERRILLDRDEAVARFIAGESGEIKIDLLTKAYNDIALVPDDYRQFLSDKASFVGEVGEALNPLSHMVYKGDYYDNGEKRQVILLSMIDQVEFGVEEIFYSGVIVVSLVALLMFMFGALLYRLSKQLIDPLNDIAKQLNSQSGCTDTAFSVPSTAAVEFQGLTQHLNHYRLEIQTVLKREQAFARYASHELRTPLTVIKGANGLLTKTPSNDFQQRQIERIGDASNQMAAMVDALLGLVRYDRSGDDTPLRTFTAQELSSIVELNSAHADDKKILIKQIITSVPSIKATEPVMNMLIGNLIRNAIAATQAGDVTIELSETEIRVTDNGHGLNHSQTVSEQNATGHGLGLLIVDDICKRYGWAFLLSNNPQGGCSAHLSFVSSKPTT